MLSNQVLRLINDRKYGLYNPEVFNEHKIKVVEFENEFIMGIHFNFETYKLFLAMRPKRKYHLDGWSNANYKNVQQFENSNIIISLNMKLLVIFKNEAEEIKFKLKYG